MLQGQGINLLVNSGVSVRAMVAPLVPDLCSQHVHPAAASAHLWHLGSPRVLSPRDGRVSENTVCLIRKLLVLDPQQRLTASEVLDSLSSIIASWYVLCEEGDGNVGSLATGCVIPAAASRLLPNRTPEDDL